MELQRQSRVPIFAPRTSDRQHYFPCTEVSPREGDCNHHFHRGSYGNTNYFQAMCPACIFPMRTWFNYCIKCGVLACDYCSRNFEPRFRYYQDADDEGSRVSVLQWAEAGVVPYRAKAVIKDARF